ncbi:serine/threonine protein kinase [Stigmatella hybrida]|uniref:serine/threonine protein kinase n=1 Tax=Stigmatella hybrida TaxID=394097 RepID=UPI001CDB3880|nr:serine/threonine-protein kinase [Stigmatella hybrida]
MQSPRTPELNPAFLPLGTVIGAWRVVAWAGGGVQGAVYQAVPDHDERAAPAALKLALLPRDPRFAREVALLSRVKHPHIPRLKDSGTWQHPGGTLHPFLVMDWVDGTPLYDWAGQHRPSSRQVLLLLAQVARALQALHAQGCLHRDVKGGNILVRPSGGSALLTDLGSGRYPDAETLTPSTLPPGTPAYRSPEACLFELQFFRDPQARYSAQPADDLYALGVTAYRLVTGEYPELGAPTRDEQGTWHLDGIASAAPSVLNPQVDARLNALILRMLARRPEQRGTAVELAEALEQASGASVPSSEARPTQWESPSRPLHLGLAAAALLALGIWLCAVTPQAHPDHASAVTPEAGGARLEDGGTAGLGDEAVATSMETSFAPSVPGGSPEDTLPEPTPGQVRPNAKGRCPHPKQIAREGGCWVKMVLNRDECEMLNGVVLNGTCYVPVPHRERQPTSQPATPP